MNVLQLDQNAARTGASRIRERTHIQSSLAPFYTVDETTIYPSSVLRALQALIDEYNDAFMPLVRANREWVTDYRYCIVDGRPVNWVVQIDMNGMTADFLDKAATMKAEEVREILRPQIFEIENSIAMYQFLARIFERNNTSFFRTNFCAVLNGLRQRFGKQIALLAVTQEKFDAMRLCEFGKSKGEVLSDEEVKRLSGFDHFFGPNDFRDHIRDTGSCEYLLYARTSDPIEKLKDPKYVVDHPLLGDERIRRIIKEHTLTFSVDDPLWPVGDIRRINDTKRYQLPMGMAFEIAHEADLFSPALADHLRAGKPHSEFKGEQLSSKLEAYLGSVGIDPADVISSTQAVRCKPIQGAYGCYGHLTGFIPERDFRYRLRRNLGRMGNYILQPEMITPILQNAVSGERYAYIDRNFFGDIGGGMQFLGGFRAMMPIDSNEAKSNRIHGNRESVWGEIVA